MRIIRCLEESSTYPVSVTRIWPAGARVTGRPAFRDSTSRRARHLPSVSLSHLEDTPGSVQFSVRDTHKTEIGYTGLRILGVSC